MSSKNKGRGWQFLAAQTSNRQYLIFCLRKITCLSPKESEIQGKEKNKHYQHQHAPKMSYLASPLCQVSSTCQSSATADRQMDRQMDRHVKLMHVGEGAGPSFLNLMTCLPLSVSYALQLYISNPWMIPQITFSVQRGDVWMCLCGEKKRMELFN